MTAKREHRLDFAQWTAVPAEQTRAEIERLLAKVGCKEFVFATDGVRAVLMFRSGGRQYRFELELPGSDHPLVLYIRPGGPPRDPGRHEAAMAQYGRMRWRTLLLLIKARMAAIEAEIISFEEAFLAETVLPGGRTVAQSTAAQIGSAYANGKVQPLLPGY